MRPHPLDLPTTLRPAVPTPPRHPVAALGCTLLMFVLACGVWGLYVWVRQ